MGRSIIEKIIQTHTSDEVAPGRIVWMDLDVRSARDFGGPNVVKSFEAEYGDAPVQDPDKTVFTFDLCVPACSLKYADHQQVCREFARRQGFRVFDVDEGINMMKAMLLAEGYPLYDQIWSDQPPLLTYVLAVAFRAFGYDANVARLVVLVFSVVLLWAAWRFLRVIGGVSCAFIGSLLIILLPHFVQLSVSAMVGLPAVALAMVSVSRVLPSPIIRLDYACIAGRDVVQII